MWARYRTPIRSEMGCFFCKGIVFRVLCPGADATLPRLVRIRLLAGSGRQCQFLFLFQSRQHPQVVRQDLPGHRHFPMDKSFGAQRAA